MNNEDRAKMARKAVNLISDGVEIDSKMSDLIANIQHLCDEEGFDFNEILDKANQYYQAEYLEENMPEVKVKQ